MTYIKNICKTIFVYIFSVFGILRPGDFIFLLGRTKHFYYRHEGFYLFYNDYKKYFLEGSYLESKIKVIKKDLDKESIQLIDKIIQNIQLLYNHNIVDSRELFDHKELIEQKKFRYYSMINAIKYNHKFAGEPDPTVFYYKHGIYHIPGIKHFLSGKSILDLGAYIGDSAFIFMKSIPEIDKIYCFEPLQANYELLKKTIYKNKLENKFIPVKKGVGKNNSIVYMSENGIGARILNEGERKLEKNTKIEIITIDNFLGNKGIDNVGLMKFDIEGYERDAIQGAEKTIKKNKPILIISIYHTCKDFFEIKPLIESRNLGYKFKIVKCMPTDIILETVLICYT